MTGGTHINIHNAPVHVGVARMIQFPLFGHKSRAGSECPYLDAVGTGEHEDRGVYLEMPLG
jgi:hypothetical protein